MWAGRQLKISSKTRRREVKPFAPRHSHPFNKFTHHMPPCRADVILCQHRRKPLTLLPPPLAQSIRQHVILHGSGSGGSKQQLGAYLKNLLSSLPVVRVKLFQEELIRNHKPACSELMVNSAKEHT